MLVRNSVVALGKALMIVVATIGDRHERANYAWRMGRSRRGRPRSWVRIVDPASYLLLGYHGRRHFFTGHEGYAPASSGSAAHRNGRSAAALRALCAGDRTPLLTRQCVLLHDLDDGRDLLDHRARCITVVVRGGGERPTRIARESPIGTRHHRRDPDPGRHWQFL